MLTKPEAAVRLLEFQKVRIQWQEPVQLASADASACTYFFTQGFEVCVNLFCYSVEKMQDI